jgi:hypothetical protein
MIKLIKRYHPERHYMRGPGPKWLEKHSGGAAWQAPSHRWKDMKCLGDVR